MFGFGLYFDEPKIRLRETGFVSQDLKLLAIYNNDVNEDLVYDVS